MGTHVYSANLRETVVKTKTCSAPHFIKSTAVDSANIRIWILSLPQHAQRNLARDINDTTHIPNTKSKPSHYEIFWHTRRGRFGSVQSFSHVQLFLTPRATAHQASLSITNPQSLLKLMSIESVMPSNHLILCHPLLLPPSIFSHASLFASGGQSVGVSALASVLPMNIQYWFPLGWTSWISLLSNRPSRVFSNTTIQKH